MSYDKQFPGLFHTSLSYSAPTTQSAAIAAPGAGKSLVITDLILEANTSTTFKFHEGNTSASLFNMRHWAANSQIVSMTAPLMLAENQSFHITTAATLTVSYIAGYILDR